MTEREQAEFNDPRLVAVYDAEFGWDVDDDYFASVVAERPAAQVLDLGCGTGRLATGLAARGYEVTGVDPAQASLDAARLKPGADKVRWIRGTSADLPDQAFDVAVMTSHVTQFVVDDDEWARTLTDLHRAIRPGGRLVFDTRDPDDQRWLRWNPRDSRRTVELPDGRQVETWADAGEPVRGQVPVTLHYAFSSGEELLSTAVMRFRPLEDLTKSLLDHGFSIEHVHGGWHSEPVGHPDGELLVTAQRSA